MKIIVVGCGKVGTTLIASLVSEGHDVIAIDNVPSIVSEITDVYDVMGLCGNGVECNTLIEAGVDRTELFIAVTGSDELNMLACFIAKKMGAKHTIARVRQPDYDQNIGFMKQQLDISVIINPEMLAAQELYNVLKLPSAVKIETFSRRNFEMIELRLKNDSPLIGVKLAELRKRFLAKFLVCVVQRGENVFIPGGNFTLEAGDRIGITATPAEIQKLLRMIGMVTKQSKSMMILGASRTAYHLAKDMIASGTDVKIIEKNLAVANEFCEAIPDAVVIHGDGAHQELLLEEGLKNMDAFVSLTGMDEENILISYFAQSLGVPKVATKTNRQEFTALASNLGLECLFSPRKIISDIVLQYARALQNSLGSKVETLYKLMDEKAEALEFIVQNDFRHCGIPLKNMDLKPNTLIAGIIRGRKIIIPSGDDTIETGDRVVVISSPQKMDDLSDIIK